MNGARLVNSPMPGSALVMVEDLTQNERLRKLEIEASNLRLIRNKPHAPIVLTLHNVMSRQYADNEQGLPGLLT